MPGFVSNVVSTAIFSYHSIIFLKNSIHAHVVATTTPIHHTAGCQFNFREQCVKVLDAGLDGLIDVYFVSAFVASLEISAKVLR